MTKPFESLVAAVGSALKFATPGRLGGLKINSLIQELSSTLNLFLLRVNKSCLLFNPKNTTDRWIA